MAQYIPPQIDYTSRDFDALRADLIGLVRSRVPSWTGDDPSDFAVAMIDAFSYMGDTMSYYIDRAANESSLSTATRMQTVLDLAALFGYTPAGPTPAMVQLTFRNVSLESVDIPVGTQVSAPLALGPYTEVFFEVIQSATGVVPGASVTLWAVEGKTVNTDVPGQIANDKPLPTKIGVSTGYVNQEHLISEAGTVSGTVKVYVGQQASFTAWKYAENLMEFGPYDQVFTTRPTTSGNLKVVFGDGVNGAIPANGELISATYRTSVGVAGNIQANHPNVAVSFIPGLSQALINSLTVSVPYSASGGADADNVIVLRNKLKRFISSRRRAVTASDYENLATATPYVSQAKLVASSPANVTLRVQTANDGSATPGIESGVPTKQWYSTADYITRYLDDKKPIGTTLVVSPPVYVPVHLGLSVVAKPGYRNRDVKLDVAKRLLASTSGLFGFGNYGFGTKVYASDIITAVAVLGSVESVTIERLQRSAFVTGAVKVDSTHVTYSGYHTFLIGDEVEVTGVDPTDFNRIGTVTAVTTSTFTIQLASGSVSGTPVFSLGGVATVGSVVADLVLAEHEIAYLPNTALTVSVTGGLV